MNGVSLFEHKPAAEKTMTTKELANVLGVSSDSILLAVKRLNLTENIRQVPINGKMGYVFTVAQATAIKKMIEQNMPIAQAVGVVTLKIITLDDTQCVSARDLHASLSIGRDFSTWIKERIEKYEFIEGKDFSPKMGKSTGGRPTVEYYLSLSMAKELAIVENNEKGRQIRQYLIKVEQAWNTPEMIMARALQVSNKAIHSLTEQLSLAEKTIEEQKPKAEYYDTLIERGNSTNLRNTAKELGIPEKQFIKQLQLDRFLYRDKHNQLCPYAEYVQKGYFEMKEWQHGQKSGIQTLITVTGKQYFIGKYKKVAIAV